MLILFYILVIEQILQGLHNLWEGFRWLRMAQRRGVQHSGFYAPKAAVICPVKGLESGLEQNLAALVNFDYPEYEVFFAMASIADPAHAIVNRIVAANKRAHIVIAGEARDCGEKVNNLRAAVLQAAARFDVYVFCDSDGRPLRNWLTRMVAPLGDAKLGAVTTFRWYFPRGRSLWSALASAWNAPAVTYLGEHSRNFCWGGGTAIRREHFEHAGVYESWTGSVSDDLSLTHALRVADLPILYVPECLVPSFLECDAAQLLEFTNRQLLILRVYEPQLWALGGLAHLLYCGAVLSGLGIFFFNLFAGLTAMNILLLTLVPPVLCMVRGVLRLAAVMELLPEWKQRLLADGWIWTILAAMSPFLALWNSAAALVSRRTRWRGVRYELVSPTQTNVVGR